MASLRVLIVEDNPLDAELVLRELRRSGFEPVWHRVDTEVEFLARIQDGPEIILSDYEMPQFSGPRALELLGNSGLEIPFIIISGTIGEDVAVEVMKLGAADYLLKDRLGRLGLAINQAISQSLLRQERARTLEELQRTHDQLQRLLEHSPAVIYSLTLENGTVIPQVVSDNITRLLGCTVEESRGLSWWQECVHPDDLTRATASVAETIEQGFCTLEYRIRHKDGHYVHVEDHRRLVLDPSGERVEIAGVMTDITERQRLQAEVRLRDQRLNAFFSGAAVGMALLDKDLRFVQINDTLAEMNGVPQKDHLGRTVSEILPDIAPTVEPLINRILTTGDTIPAFTLSGETARDPGVKRHWIESLFAIEGLDGRPDGVGAIVVEITERKRMEESLRLSEERFRQLAENIQEVFWITDVAKQRIIYISPAFEKIWGLSIETLYENAQAWIDSIHDDERAHVLHAAMTRQVDGTYHEEYRIIRPDGTIRWIRDRAFPVKNEVGDVYRVVGVAEDITERKKLEQQFLRAQRMESIGTLAGGIAHDLNNVLTPVLMAVDLLKMDEENPRRRKILSTIESSAQRGADMVEQVLSFARGMEGQRIQVQVGHLLTEIEKFALETLPKNIRISSDIPQNLWIVQGDATQLHQVLLNLCVNARDAMPDGGTLTLSARNIHLDDDDAASNIDAKPGPHVCLVVADTGTGIDPDVIDRIFEPFFTTKDVGKGTGLGLSTTLGIVKSHGGSIQVHSIRGAGTRFLVYLPADPGSVDAHASSSPSDLPVGRGELVLLIDDEELVRETTKLTLEAFGYRVLMASNGHEAIELHSAHEQEIALVLTDMMMPLMDGATLIRRLREANARLRFIAASGVNFKGLDVSGDGSLKIHHLPKPYTAQMLLETLQEALR